MAHSNLLPCEKLPQAEMERKTKSIFQAMDVIIGSENALCVYHAIANQLGRMFVDAFPDETTWERETYIFGRHLLWIMKENARVKRGRLDNRS